MPRIGCLSLVTVLALSSLSASAQTTDPLDLVSPNIGGIGQLLTATVPYVQYPHGMARLAPITTPGVEDRYLADSIYGFTAGPARLMIYTGARRSPSGDLASGFDHDFETATPYYYEADLPRWNARAEMTVTPEAAFYRFTFNRPADAHVAFSISKDGEMSAAGANAVAGSQNLDATFGSLARHTGQTREYFYAEVAPQCGSHQLWQGGAAIAAGAASGAQAGYSADCTLHSGEQILVRVGVSYISTEQAHRNLDREVGTRSFDEVKSAARGAWQSALGAIAVTGGTLRQKTIFYTALYRSMLRMTDITEDGRYYSGYDHQVHPAQGHDFYVDDGLWDTFRSEHPLQLLLNSTRQEDIVRSYLRMYQQSGWLPSFPSVAGEQAIMIGRHVDQLILDLYAKGYRDFDVELAYQAMKKNATEATMIPWSRGPLTPIDRVYFEKGFFPALAWGENETVPQVTGERRQAVSVTLEAAYDDWCVAQLAQALGKTADAEYFLKLAHNYQNVFDKRIDFMAPRGADGSWVQHFDPKLGGGQGGRDYTTEVNSWLYTFSVQQDVQGLIDLFGGRDAFNRRLDQLFVEQYGEPKYKFLSQFPDATGLVGNYAQGNEPSFHIAYLYDFSGQPWKTQRRVRQLMDVWYGAGPHGIPGDDDGGETSSWYVLSALGFYPICPGSPVYEIGSPLFARSVIRMGNGKAFTILAHNTSAQNKYIQSALLNGKPLSRPWFAHAQIANGGTLVLEMTSQPNLEWGSRPQDAPPSMTPAGQ